MAAACPRWYNAALTHKKWMGNPSSPTLSSNCENRRACFCQTSPGMHVWGVIVPIRTVFMRSNRPRGWNRGKTFAGVPNCHGCQGERRGNKAKQSKRSAYGLEGISVKKLVRQHQKRSICIQVACNYFFNRKFANQRAIVQQENQIHRVTGLVEWRKEDWWGALLQSFSPLSLVLILFLFPCLFRRLQHTEVFFFS